MGEDREEEEEGEGKRKGNLCSHPVPCKLPGPRDWPQAQNQLQRDTVQSPILKVCTLQPSCLSSASSSWPEGAPFLRLSFP